MLFRGQDTSLHRSRKSLSLAEDALHDAFGAALERWPKEGVPANPRAWLVSTGRFKAIDAMRRRARFDASQAAIVEQLGAEARDAATFEDESIEDDRLRLMFNVVIRPLRRKLASSASR
jgi:RNA polymerase sigma-70 factor, ECF subfamily